ncbi:MAG: hypothetical protein J6U68_00840 [Clostridia bacterium]|nr:hypothetical protein [Clostridia bacterium]
MKKALSIFLIAIMLIASLSACTSAKDDGTESATQAPIVPVETQASTTDDGNSSNADSNKNNGNTNTDKGKESEKESESEKAQTDEEKFASATALIANKNYEEAYNILINLTSYAPAKEKLKNFFYAPQKISTNWKYSDSEETNTRATEYVYNEMGNLLETSDDQIWTYDENGNVLTGNDLVYGDQYYTYTYKDGKLYQKKHSSSQTTYTYSYNTDGSIATLTIEVPNYGSEVYNYEYTYYESGKIKTMSESGYRVSTYDESGRVIKVDYYDEADLEYTFNLTYGEFGVTSMEVQTVWNEMVRFAYSYDSYGKLISLTVKQYEEGTLHSSHTFEYSNHVLCYSENPNVQQRMSQITCTDIDAAADIVW